MTIGIQGPPRLSLRPWVWHYAWSCAPAPTRFATCEIATHKGEGVRDIERKGKIKRGREPQAEDAVLSRLAMHEYSSRTFHNQFNSMQTQTHTHTCTWMCLCIFLCVLNYCDWLLIKHLFWLASFRHRLLVGCWTLTLHAARGGGDATVRHVRHMPQNEARGKEGIGKGERVQRVALSAWKMSFCHMGNGLAGTQQGREREEREVCLGEGSCSTSQNIKRTTH